MNTHALTAYDDTPWVRRPDEVEATAESDTPSPVARPLLGNRDFFVGKSLSQLAREQGVGPIKDISVFAGGIPDDEDVDEMLEEIYRLREP
jgi:hypothetical protein